MKKERKIGQADELLALFVMALTAVGLLLYIVQVHIMER